MDSQRSPARQGNDNERPTSAPSGDRRDRKRQRRRPSSADTRPRPQDPSGPPMPVVQQMNSQEENAAFSTRLMLRPKPVDYQHAVLVEPGDPMPPPPPPPPRRKIIEEDEKFVWLQRRRTPLPVFNPCVHLLFNQQVVPREGLTRKEHLEILAAPREYLRGSLRDNYCVLSRPRVQKLVDMLQEEMHVSHK
ncbi:Protein of unknown function [Gryllus bimaculatus]|nr:Protein of unknown function [Gryllus bimaculatus]